jgi:tryptophan synthase alpha chain
LNLESHLRSRRDTGAKLLVPYVTGGLGREWHEVVRAVVDAGADAVEVGIPFSDPIMDGRTIQEASQRALDLGATPVGVMDAMAAIDVPAPLVVMTYYNLVARLGHERCAQHLRQCGVDGAIVPDLPYDELDGWGDAADAAGVETVLLAAPTTPDGSSRSANAHTASSTACR